MKTIFAAIKRMMLEQYVSLAEQDEDGYWVYLKDNAFWDGCHTIHEDTVKDVLRCLGEVEVVKQNSNDLTLTEPQRKYLFEELQQHALDEYPTSGDKHAKETYLLFQALEMKLPVNDFLIGTLSTWIDFFLDNIEYGGEGYVKPGQKKMLENLLKKTNEILARG